MAHNITIRADGYAEMAFVGETPWHHLGQELKEGASMDEWRKAAGMDWELLTSPVLYTGSDVFPTPFQGQYVLSRSDNNMPMSVVSNRYKPVQPSEVLGFFDNLVKENGFKLHTAGTLRDGKVLWALAETGKFAEISKDDGIGGFLLLSTSCDKSIATTARFTSVRVVCNNTLDVALGQRNHVSFTHLSKFDHQAVQAKLCKQVESFGAFIEMGKFLRKQRLGGSNAVEFVKKLVLTNEQLLNNEYNYNENRAFSKIMDLFEGEAKGAELVGDSKWGMLNAVTEYYDHHYPARNNDARLANSWFGDNDRKKAKALELLIA